MFNYCCDYKLCRLCFVYAARVIPFVPTQVLPKDLLLRRTGIKWMSHRLPGWMKPPSHYPCSCTYSSSVGSCPSKSLSDNAMVECLMMLVGGAEAVWMDTETHPRLNIISHLISAADKCRIEIVCSAQNGCNSTDTHSRDILGAHKHLHVVYVYRNTDANIVPSILSRCRLLAHAARRKRWTRPKGTI